MEWLVENLGTIAVSLVLAGIIVCVIIKMIRDRKKGISSCGCGCANCPSKGMCHK